MAMLKQTLEECIKEAERFITRARELQQIDTTDIDSYYHHHNGRRLLPEQVWTYQESCPTYVKVGEREGSVAQQFK